MVQATAINVIQGKLAGEIKDYVDKYYDGDDTLRSALQGVLACAGASANSGDCSSAAVGAAGSIVINKLIGSTTIKDPKTGEIREMTLAEKQERENLVNTILTGTVALLGGDAATASTAAKIEMENNVLTGNDVEKYYALMKTCTQNGNCDQVQQELKDLGEERTQRFKEVCGGDNYNPQLCVSEFGNLGADTYDQIRPLLKTIYADKLLPQTFFDIIENEYIDNHYTVPYIAAAKEEIYGVEKGIVDHLRDAGMMAMFGGTLKVKMPVVPITYNVSSVSVDPNRLVKPNNVPGTAQGRVNVAHKTPDPSNPSKERGFDYAMGKHGQNATNPNKSQFTISDNEVKKLLQNSSVVRSPVYNIKQNNNGVIVYETDKFVRQVNVGTDIGILNGKPTQVITIITDRKGNLVNTFPGTLDK